MTDPRRHPVPAGTDDRTCRRCGQQVFETLTAAFGLVARFDPLPSPAGCVRIDPDGTAVFLGAADEAEARRLGVPLYQAHPQSCSNPGPQERE